VTLSIAGPFAKAQVTLTDPVYQLRLDPFERKGTFSINRIRWRPISRAEKLIDLTRHVIRNNRARGLTLGETVKDGFRKAKQAGWGNIWRSTERYFSTDYQPVQESISYAKWVNTCEQPYRTLRYGEASGPLPRDALPVIVIDYEHDAEAVRRTIDSLVQQRASFGSILLLSSKSLGEDSFKDEKIKHCQEPDQYSMAVKRFAESFGNNHLLMVRAGNLFSHCFSHALAIRLSANPSARLVYTDSDRLSSGSQREDPEFKPDWNPDFELAAHYVGDTFVIAAELINQIPPDWLRHRQDALYSLLAAATPLLEGKSVEHIPEVLWHKSGTAEAPVKLERIQAILAGVNVSRPVAAVQAENNSRGYRLHYNLPTAEPAVDIIIPTKNQFRLLKPCIDSILAKTRYGHYRIVVIDNGSTERSTLTYLGELRHMARCSVLPYPHPFNYSAINNFAVSQSAADVVVLMNNDIEVISPEWLQEMVSHAIRPEVGCVGAKLYYPDGRIQHAGVILGIHGVGGHGFRLYDQSAEGYLERLQYVQNYSVVTGACLAVQRDIYQEVGGLNDQSLAIAFNDVDFCLKVREAGYRNVWTPYAELYHHESATRGEYDSREKLNGLRQEAAYITQRWGELLINDPAYNPNLSLSGTDFELSTRYVGGVSLRKTDTEVSISEHPYRVEPNISRVNQVLRLPKTSVSAEHHFKPGLSIVILTLDKIELIKPLLESLVSAKRLFADSDDINLQIVVGDTGSQDKAVHTLYQRLDGEITVVKEMKYHFSRCNNQLFKEHVIHDAVLFLNNDIIFSGPVHTLRAMYTQLKDDEDIAIVGTYLLYPNKRLQHGGIAMFDKGDLKGLCYHPGHNTDFMPPNDYDVTDVPAVTGACLMMRSSQFVSCDYFDEAYEAEAQDVDLCLKARRVGKEVKLIYCGEIIHYENATRPRGDANQRDRSRFIRKWKTYQEAIGFE
jgi:GT2 family glycosyltransferase